MSGGCHDQGYSMEIGRGLNPHQQQHLQLHQQHPPTVAPPPYPDIGTIEYYPLGYCDHFSLIGKEFERIKL